MAQAIIGSIPREVGNSWSFKLEDELKLLRLVLIDAEHPGNRDIQDWVDKVKKAVYDTQGVLDEFNIEATRRRELRGRNEMMKEVRTFFSSSNQLAFKWKMSSKVRAVLKRIKDISAERNRFSFPERHERVWRERKAIYPRMMELRKDIIGRNDDTVKVKKILLESAVEEVVSILPIVGVGGIGKTAFARYVYTDEGVSEHFPLKMWVTVSPDFDMTNIMRIMLFHVTGKVQTNVPMELLLRELLGSIDGKKYLLVLDDMWNVEPEKWERLKAVLDKGARGSKILITTRIHLPREIIATPPYTLKGLSEDASLDLFLQMACMEQQNTGDAELRDIGRKIALKCLGVPLVIRTVGASLCCKDKDEWLGFLKYKLPEVVQSEEDSIMPILRLSYDRLPSNLKQCFQFCSLFPKDYVIKKQTLINLWVAEGFIQPLDRSQHLEEIADRYFMDLLWSNFFQDFQKDSLTNKETCKMPALMHDLASSVAGFECWRVGDPNSILERTRHLSHYSISKLMCELPMNSCLKASSIRTILSVPTYREMEQTKLKSEVDLCQLIQSFKRLRIFDLHAAIVKKVPRSIYKLKHLTYLDLSHNDELKRLPNSITRLHNLQTLNLYGCSALQELPRDIWKLVNLRNLDIDHCYSLSYVPRGLKQLTSLHSLTRFILSKCKALAKNYCRLGELHGLNDLSGSLSIENLGHSRDALQEFRAANLIEKCSLESLILKWECLYVDDAEVTYEELLDELRPHSNLEKLTIEGYEGESFPKWMTVSLADSLPNLVEVRLLRCGKCKHLSQLGRLPHLKFLELRGLTELEDIESDQSPTSTTSFPSLLKLEIHYCKKLKAMPHTPLLEELNLRAVNLECITRMTGLHKLKSLDISQVESFRYLPENWLSSLTSLEHLGISECPQLTYLSGGMQHLLKLVDLSLSNCEELDLSKDKGGNILNLQGLEKLRFVDILGVPKLASLPQWLLQVNNLEHLSIKNCFKLKALAEHINDLQSLQKLEIIRCPSLTSLPKGMQNLGSLTHLKIAGCPELEERCKKNVGEDWNKIAHIPFISHKLKFNERHL